MNWNTTHVLTQESLQEKTLLAVRYRGARQDCLFLGLILCLSIVLYISKIGFYSDDWAYFSILESTENSSLLENYRNLMGSPNLRSRPVQAFLQGLIYWLFGLQPLGHHIFNTSMVLLSMWLLYFILRELRQSRTVAVVIPLVFCLMPHYSTDRLWHSAFMVTLSMLLYFLSLYADFRFLLSAGIKSWVWKIVSVLSLAGSALSYEIFMPLFFINPLLVGYLAWHVSKDATNTESINKNWHYFYLLNLAAMVGVVLYKVSTATRMGTLGFAKQLEWFGHLIWKLAKISFSMFGAKLPVTVWTSANLYADKLMIGVAIVAGLLMFTYIYRSMKQSVERESSLFFVCLTLIGFILFVAGFGIFLVNTNAIMTPTGINNRIFLASALGVAVVFVGAIGWVSSMLSSMRVYRYTFSSLIALLCAGSLFTSNVIAAFWVDSYRQQKQVVADIVEKFPQLPGKSTLLLDGICPYAGPAVVFESSWDLAGAIQIAYRDTTIHADIVTPNLHIEDKGMVTLMYGGANRTFHGYSNKLFIYHIGRKSVHYLPDAKAAEAYFQTFNPDFDNDCPPAMEGMGVGIF
jgi:hypothetical protein